MPACRPSARSVCENIPIVLCGNKVDVKNRQVGGAGEWGLVGCCSTSQVGQWLPEAWPASLYSMQLGGSWWQDAAAVKRGAGPAVIAERRLPCTAFTCSHACAPPHPIAAPQVKPKQVTFHRKKNLQYHEISAKSNYNYGAKWASSAVSVTLCHDAVLPLLKQPPPALNASAAAAGAHVAMPAHSPCHAPRLCPNAAAPACCIAEKPFLYLARKLVGDPNLHFVEQVRGAGDGWGCLAPGGNIEALAGSAGCAVACDACA